MMNAIHHDETPNFYFLHYEIRSSRRQEAQTSSQEFQMEPPDVGCYGSGGEGAIWVVRNLLLVPSFAFPPSAIIKRPPLSSTARRAGWIGCNFALNRVPADARIPIVITRSSSRRRGDESLTEKSNERLLTSSPTIIVPPEEVRAQFRRVKPLKEISVTQRGWMLDVLNVIRRLGKTEFTTTDAYAFTRELEKLHPDNRHVRDKIRQQLQVLRDAGLLLHIGRGEWRLP